MSWEVALIRTHQNNEPLDQIDPGSIIPFKQTEIAEEIQKLASIVSAGFCCDDLEWPAMSKEDWIIEFHVGSEIVVMRIRGGGELFLVLRALEHDLDARVFDCGTGEVMDYSKYPGFEKWEEFREKLE